MSVPKYDDLFDPLLQAMHRLGGSASVSEQEDMVATVLQLSDKELSEIHRGNRTKFSYRLAWARNYLKRYGFLENSSRGVWALTPDGLKHKSVDKAVVKRLVQNLEKKSEQTSKLAEVEPEGEEVTWEDELLEVLRNILPASFERLCQRLLRESGFVQVEVTGRSGDGGIDGKGIVRVGGLLSFHVIFQCKRYKGTVSSSFVRDFRGAMVGRADKGLLITTGSFSRDARAEAQRDGATPIDLLDGHELVQKLRELSIGVEVKKQVVERVEIKKEYFSDL